MFPESKTALSPKFYQPYKDHTFPKHDTKTIEYYCFKNYSLQYVIFSELYLNTNQQPSPHSRKAQAFGLNFLFPFKPSHVTSIYPDNFVLKFYLQPPIFCIKHPPPII